MSHIVAQTTSEWRRLTTPAPLSVHDVHIWRFSLDTSPLLLANLLPLLSAEEYRRSNSIRFTLHRHQYIVARATIRLILGMYLDKDPTQLCFQTNAYGKPFLPGEALRFNLSHSGALALLAVTQRREIGVDLELLRSDLGMDDIVPQNFTPGEAAIFRSLPPEQQTLGFFRCWTRKEAFVKAVGRGLDIPLNSVEVTLRPDEPAALVSISWAPLEIHRWSLREIFPGPGYVGAVAALGHDWEVSCIDFHT